MRKPNFSVVRMRQLDQKWIEAQLEQLNRTSEDLLTLSLAGAIPFAKGEIIEVHLPVGACFKALVADCIEQTLSLRIIEHLNSSNCHDDAESPSDFGQNLIP